MIREVSWILEQFRTCFSRKASFDWFVVSFLCLDLIWRPIGKRVRFVLVRDGEEKFILICSDVSLSPSDIIRVYSYRFKIEVNFKILKHVMGAFFYRFWTTAWPHIGKQNESDLSSVKDSKSQGLIRDAANAIEAFMNFGCIATGILQILSLNFHGTIWSKYRGWLRTVRSTIPSEEVVRCVIQHEYFHNFWIFKNSGIYRHLEDTVRAYVGFVEQVGKGDLTGQLTVTGQDDLNVLGKNLNAMTGGLHNLASRMREATANISSATSEILASTRQQLAGMDQINSAMAGIDQAAAQTEAGTRQAEKAATDLNELAEEIKEIVAQYKLV